MAAAIGALALFGVLLGVSSSEVSASAATAPRTVGDQRSPMAQSSDDVAEHASASASTLASDVRALLRRAEQGRARRADALALPPDVQIVSYYGNPYTPAMGVLGSDEPEAVVRRLLQHAATYDALNGPAPVVPALHLVVAVAQPSPMSDGRYLLSVRDEDVRRYVALAERYGLLLFLDVQVGRSTVEAELRRLRPYLRSPRVHVALDPEFAVGAGEVPGQTLGSLRAEQINTAQAFLQRVVTEEGLPPKLLIVHQFTDSMVQGTSAIERYPDVELVVTMDGFGPAAVKRVLYQRFARRPYASAAGIKLFFEYDPDLMSEREVLALEPPPRVIIYQ